MRLRVMRVPRAYYCHYQGYHLCRHRFYLPALLHGKAELLLLKLRGLPAQIPGRVRPGQPSFELLGSDLAHALPFRRCDFVHMLHADQPMTSLNPFALKNTCIRRPIYLHINGHIEHPACLAARIDVILRELGESVQCRYAIGPQATWIHIQDGRAIGNQVAIDRCTIKINRPTELPRTMQCPACTPALANQTNALRTPIASISWT